MKCVILSVLAAGLLGGCRSNAPEAKLQKAEQLQSLFESDRYDEARRLLVDDPRRWFGERSGEGNPWRPGSAKAGPWSNWDREFNSESDPVRWWVEGETVVTRFSEINDYYRLLERGEQTFDMVYFFDDAGRIEGTMIRSTGERDPGLTDEFMAWANANEPNEIAYLMPGGNIDPSCDRPPRFRALLNRWRSMTGRPELP